MDETRFSIIKKWYRETFTEKSFVGAADGLVRYSLQKESGGKGIIILVSGRAEFIEKYLEFSWDVRNLGCSICLYDHFGQGGSGRQLGDSHKGHIDDFNIYVDDLKTLVNDIVIPEYGSPVYLVTHSMGGVVATLFCASYPGLVDGLVLASPMFQINSGKILSPRLAEFVCNLVCFAGGGNRYVWGTGPFNPGLAFKGNDLTTDKNRFQFNLELVHRYPEVALGGPTFGWLLSAYRAMRKARRAGALIACPILVFQAMADIVVGLPEMRKFCLSANMCELVKFPGARHELFMEKDLVRNVVIAKVKEFVDRGVSNSVGKNFTDITHQ